jgi:hypothetical protein
MWALRLAVLTAILVVALAFGFALLQPAVLPPPVN